MTLDEAIKHCEEVAEYYKQGAEETKERSCSVEKDINDNCLECASEHRQLAEWLRELKGYREQLPNEIAEAKKLQTERLEANVKSEKPNPYLIEFFKGYICGFSYVEGIIAKILEEVNADGEKEET